MQSTSSRLQQAIWTSLRCAKPNGSFTHSNATARTFASQIFRRSVSSNIARSLARRCQQPTLINIRPYSDSKSSDINRKIDDAQKRISDTIEARAESVVESTDPEQDTLKRKRDETIIHTLPESSSIVYNADSPGETAVKAAATEASQSSRQNTSSTSSSEETASQSSKPLEGTREALPSQVAARYSKLRDDFTHFMDNFQTHVFTASKRLNDLTGYSSIEQLKRDIEAQEQAVRQARQDVHDSRASYQAAVTTRSDTQREVNDLLHRKHAWSPADLERFTNLYRSDHANEHSEQKAHEQLSQAEQRYEEASTKLSKSILARYHEEQVWSDKIRQMSTWGTWGLMGLNVLLFVLFQIAVEPWRRRRLVRGFEEKVQEAIREQSAEQELRTLFHLKTATEEGRVQGAIAATGEGDTDLKEIRSAQENATPEQVPAAALTGALAAEEPSLQEMAERTQIEQAVETVANVELLAEEASEAVTSSDPIPISDSPSTAVPEAVVEQQHQTLSEDLPPVRSAPYQDLPFVLGTHVRAYFDRANHYVQSLFNEETTLTVSRKELTSRVLEGAFFGAVGTVTLFWALGVSTVHGR